MSTDVLLAIARSLKKQDAFEIRSIEFPTLSFSDVLALEAKDVESRIKKAARAS